MTDRRKLTVFNNMTLDGFFTDANGDMSWAHQNNDEEFNSFVAGNAGGGGVLLLGRVTYELMASYWPTPQAMKEAPEIARQMNQLQKIVFSRNLSEVTWSNTKLVKRGLAATVRKLKSEPGPDMVILGSGSIVAQLAQEGLVDEYQIVLNPLVLGEGSTLFSGLRGSLDLKLVKTRVFRNGKVLLCYKPARRSRNGQRV